MYEIVSLYRVLSFSKPIGPWRATKKLAQEDAVDVGLGSYDEWGKFWTTVPGTIQRIDLPTRVLLTALANAGLADRVAA